MKRARVPGTSQENPNLLVQSISSEVARREGVSESTIAQAFTAYLLSAVLGEAQRLNGGEPIVLPKDWVKQVAERGIFATSRMLDDGYHVWLDPDHGAFEEATEQYLLQGLTLATGGSLS